jgi:hypothetical protein
VLISTVKGTVCDIAPQKEEPARLLRGRVRKRLPAENGESATANASNQSPAESRRNIAETRDLQPGLWDQEIKIEPISVMND